MMVDLAQIAVAFRLEKGHAFSGGTIEIGRFLWFEAMDEHIPSLPDALVLNLALGARPVHTRVDRIASDYAAPGHEAGRLLVMMPAAKYRLSAPRGAFRSLRCTISCARLSEIMGDEIDWSQLSELGGELKQGTEIERLLARIHDELMHERSGRERAIEALAEILCIELIRHFRKPRPQEQAMRTGGLSAWRLRIAMDRIHALLPAPRIAELAQLCGLTERQLSRAFKAETGVSIGRFVGEVTIERAHRLLTTTEMSINEIAGELGFASPDSFAQSYRRVTGMRPSQARLR